MSGKHAGPFWNAQKLMFRKLGRDLREELHLPLSAIINLEFPSEFPSLPSWTSIQNNYSNAMPNLECLPTNVVQQEEEQSWYYYLASRALRKKANSIVNLLYHPGQLSWVENIEHMISQAALQENELDQWRTLLPAALQFDDTPDDAPEDMAFILECRQLHWRQIAHRPLLYYALHQPRTDPYFYHVLPLAQKCLDYCALTIKRLVRPHYYEGTWFIQRAIATATLLILATQIRGAPLYVADWRSLVSSALQALSRWKADAQDLDRAQLILRKIIDELDKRDADGFHTVGSC